MAKILIVAFDSLEPTLVEKWNLKNLKQKYHGKVYINVEPLSTPTVWASFLTGKTPKEHGIHGFSVSRFDAKQLASKVGLNRIFDRTLAGNILIEKALDKLSIPLTMPSIKKKNIETIFSRVDRLCTLDFPSWDTVKHYEEIRRKLYLAIGNEKLGKDLRDLLWSIYFKKVDKVQRLIDKDWDLLAVHFLASDIIQHLCWKEWFGGSQMHELHSSYLIFDRTARQFEQLFDGRILIISDHGQKKGLHTPFGFFSSNVPIRKKIPLRITDFKDVIERWLKN